MQVISLLSRKGGSGKTTLAVHWAVEAGLSSKKRVVLVDMDAQGSCSSWFGNVMHQHHCSLCLHLGT